MRPRECTTLKEATTEEMECSVVVVEETEDSTILGVAAVDQDLVTATATEITQPGADLNPGSTTMITTEEAGTGCMVTSEVLR